MPEGGKKALRQSLIAPCVQPHKWSATLDGGQMYRALIETFVEAIRQGEPPSPLEDQLECIKVALAAKMARRDGGDIYLEDVPLEEYFDGHAFGAEYARMRQASG